MINEEWTTYMPAPGEGSNLDYWNSSAIEGHAHDYIVHERVPQPIVLERGTPEPHPQPTAVPTPSTFLMGVVMLGALVGRRPKR